MSALLAVSASRAVVPCNELLLSLLCANGAMVARNPPVDHVACAFHAGGVGEAPLGTLKHGATSALGCCRVLCSPQAARASPGGRHGNTQTTIAQQHSRGRLQRRVVVRQQLCQAVKQELAPGPALVNWKQPGPGPGPAAGPPPVHHPTTALGPVRRKRQGAPRRLSQRYLYAHTTAPRAACWPGSCWARPCCARPCSGSASCNTERQGRRRRWHATAAAGLGRGGLLVSAQLRHWAGG